MGWALALSVIGLGLLVASTRRGSHRSRSADRIEQLCTDTEPAHRFDRDGRQTLRHASSIEGSQLRKQRRGR
jgi:hypothetical protein